jgi:hypothetical protein
MICAWQSLQLLAGGRVNESYCLPRRPGAIWRTRCKRRSSPAVPTTTVMAAEAATHDKVQHNRCGGCVQTLSNCLYGARGCSPWVAACRAFGMIPSGRGHDVLDVPSVTALPPRRG